jgi:predicted nuclease of predicted toxin-antitoxin system
VRILADENVHAAVVAGLRDHGYDVEWIARSSPSDQDEAILGRPDIGDWILLTYDSDFGDLIFNHGMPVPAALIYSRLERLKPQAVTARIIAALSRQPLLGHLVVLARDGDRYKSWMDRQHG